MSPSRMEALDSVCEWTGWNMVSFMCNLTTLMVTAPTMLRYNEDTTKIIVVMMLLHENELSQFHARTNRRRQPVLLWICVCVCVRVYVCMCIPSTTNSLHSTCVCVCIRITSATNPLFSGTLDQTVTAVTILLACIGRCAPRRHRRYIRYACPMHSPMHTLCLVYAYAYPTHTRCIGYV